MVRTELSRRRFFQVAGATTLAAAAGPTLSLAGARAAGTNLVFTTFQNADVATAEGKWLKDFGAKNGMSITMTSVPGSGFVLYLDKLKTQLAGGKPPDVARMWTGYLATPYVPYMAPLDSYYEKYNWTKKFVPSAIAKTVVNGKHYGVPETINGMVFWYRKDAFEKAGIKDLPTTYAALEDAAERLKQAGYAPLAEGAKFGWDPMRFFEYLLEMTAGPQLHDQLRELTASWENDAVVKAFQLFKKWVDNKWINDGFLATAPDDADALLVQGKAAMLLTGPWEEGNIRAAKLSSSQFDLLVPPTDRTPLRFSSFVEQWQITSASDHKDAAAQVLDAYLEPEVQRQLLNGAPATIGSLDAEKAPLGAKLFDLVTKHETFLVQDQSLPQIVTNTYFAQQASVASGSTTPEQAASAIQQTVSQYKSSQ